MKTTLYYAKIQLMRVLRDPVTLIVLFTIPLILLLLFGAFVGGSETKVNLKVAVINNSDTQFAKDFTKQLSDIDVFTVNDENLTSEKAQQYMRESKLDGVIELPDGFGTVRDNKPSGKAKVTVDQSDLATGDIMMGVMNTVAEKTNVAINGAEPPITIERTVIEGVSTRAFDNLYAMFTGMAIMMTGIFGVASTIPSDKKTGILRRMRVTPFKSSHLVGGLAIAYLGVSIAVVAVMTILAVTAFNMELRGSLIDFGVFVLLSSILMIALGIMVGGWAKNTTQSDIYGQIVFITSLAFSGLWVPRVLMPEWLQNITAFLPLTPVIEGLGRIVTEGVSITSLGMQLAVIVGWLVVVYIVATKTFRWE